jgi:hypothetical protein
MRHKAVGKGEVKGGQINALRQYTESQTDQGQRQSEHLFDSPNVSIFLQKLNIMLPSSLSSKCPVSLKLIHELVDHVPEPTVGEVHRRVHCGEDIKQGYIVLPHGLTVFEGNESVLTHC